MEISSDVNVIFAYIEETDRFHVPVVVFLSPYKRAGYYILLDQVKTSFIYTYSDFLRDTCTFIEKSIIDYRESRSGILKKPSPFLINSVMRQKIKDRIEKSVDKNDARYDTINRFVKKLLTEYSIVLLYENRDKLAEFRIKYLEMAEKEADSAISRFLRKFKDFEVINFADVENFDEWLEKLKKSELRIFNNKRDYEDMRIAAQYIGYNDKIKRLGFATCDKEFYRSLEKIISYFKLTAGKLSLITLKR